MPVPVRDRSIVFIALPRLSLQTIFGKGMERGKEIIMNATLFAHTRKGVLCSQ